MKDLYSATFPVGSKVCIADREFLMRASIPAEPPWCGAPLFRRSVPSNDDARVLVATALYNTVGTYKNDMAGR
jgi:hypothetical protein